MQSTTYKTDHGLPLMEKDGKEILTGSPSDYGLPGERWYPNQRHGIETALNLDDGKFLFLEAPTGCHAPGQGILMYDGSVKNVENIKIGDSLMGPDSEPRNVLSLAYGASPMVRIIPVKGDPFIVNVDHVLTLQRTCGKRGKDSVRSDCKDGEIVDVSVRTWLSWSKWYKHIYKLVRTGASFSVSDLDPLLFIEPYFMGVLLGNGGYTTGSPCVTTVDVEIEEEIYRQAAQHGLSVRRDIKPDSIAPSYYMTGEGGSNFLTDRLRHFGLFGKGSSEKFIPKRYMVATLEDRLNVLAGLMDTDGHLDNNCYDYISKSRQLAEDVAFLARSLGMAAYMSRVEKYDQNGHGGIYYRVYISGDVDAIPCRLPRKQASPRRQKKNVLRTGLSVEYVGDGEYYGFELDGDGRYLMDDFTITHNTGKSFVPALVSRFRPVTVMVATRDLQRQYENSFDWFRVVWGQAHYPCVLPSRVEMYERAYGEKPTRADCTINHKRETCPVKDECPYEVAKKEAARSGAAVLNYAYGFYTHWWRLPSPGDVFCDEAHRLPDVLADLISIEISERQRRMYSLPSFPLVSGSGIRAIESMRKYLEACIKALEDWRDLAKSIGGDEKQMIRWQRFKMKIESLQDALSVAEPDSWYMASGTSVGRLIARPIFPRQYASAILDENARSAVLMSATIGSPEILADRLGIPFSQIEFLSVPHSFPKKNRPVIWIKNAPKISSKSGHSAYARQADIISNLLSGMPEHKGIIHTSSWKHTEMLHNLLAQRGHVDRLFNTRGPRVRTVRKFKNAKGGQVAISPSWSEGLDFPDDEARFAIIAKIPWRSLADPVTRMRLKSDGGREWYDWTACLGVVQRAGRVVRHLNDWGITYIVDSNWTRVRRLAPKWFEVTEV